jgi:FkbM family methyltransferase
MSQPARSFLQKALRRFGRELVPYHHAVHPDARRIQLMRARGVTLVIDIGANTGQYATQLRGDGYVGRIVSIEPLAVAFAELARVSAQDPKWKALQLAIGERDGTAEINVSANSVSSSLLPMLPAHLESAPASAFTGKQTVELRRVDTVFSDICESADVPFVRIDTQGYERAVLDGAKQSLQRIVGAQIEMSVVPMYDGEATLDEMIRVMRELGFTLMGLEPGFSEPASGRMLQADGIFFRESETAARV